MEQRISLRECVIGIEADAERGIKESLCAIVVPDFDHLRRSKITNAREIIRYEIDSYSRSLPSYQRVRDIVLRKQELPRTQTRKLKRYLLGQELLQTDRRDEPEKIASPQEMTPLERQLFELLVEKTDYRGPASAHCNIELDAGLDSLAKVEFFSFVEGRMGIGLPEDAAGSVFDLQDLARMVEKAGHRSQDESSDRSWNSVIRKTGKADLAGTSIEKDRRWAKLPSRIFWGLSRTIFKYWLPMRITGIDNLQMQPPFLICPNHVSYLDGFLVTSSIPWRIVDRVFFLGASEYFRNALTRTISWIGRVIPVDPDLNIRRAMRLGSAGLKQNNILVVFPEGARSIDGKLMELKMGPAILSAELQLPIVPVAIQGSYEVWPRGSRKIRRHPVTVQFGQPIQPPEDLQGLHAYREILGRLEASLKEMTAAAANSEQ